jgi:hypothetical protein
VLAGNGNELIALGTLWDSDSVLVGPLLDFYILLASWFENKSHMGELTRIGPGVEEGVAEGLNGVGSGLGGRGLQVVKFQVRKIRVPADAGNELVSGSRLRCWETVGIQPLFEL